MTEIIKNKISLKNSLYHSKDFREIQKLSTEISDIIFKRKDEYQNHLSFYTSAWIIEFKKRGDSGLHPFF